MKATLMAPVVSMFSDLLADAIYTSTAPYQFPSETRDSLDSRVQGSGWKSLGADMSSRGDTSIASRYQRDRFNFGGAVGWPYGGGTSPRTHSWSLQSLRI